MSDQVGRIFTAPELEQAAIDTVKLWIDNYLTTAATQIGWAGPALARPRSYTTRNRTEHFPDDQLPQIVAVSPGLAGEPTKRSKSSGPGFAYRAVFLLGVGAIVSAQDEPSTKALAKVYAAALRVLLAQHPTLGGVTSGLEWYDESYDDIPDTEEVARTIYSGVVYFRATVDDVATWPGGPSDPSTPPTTLGEVERVIITLNREAI